MKKIKSKCKSVCKLANKLGLAGNVGYKVVGEHLIAHFKWFSLEPKQAITKYFDELPEILGVLNHLLKTNIIARLKITLSLSPPLPIYQNTHIHY